MKCLLFALLLTGTIVCSSANDDNMDGWVAYRLNNAIVDPFLVQLVKRVNGFVMEETKPGLIKDVAVSPKYQKMFETALLHRRVTFKIISSNVGGDLTREKNSNDAMAYLEDLKIAAAYSSGSVTPVRDVTTYFAKHNEINSWLTSVAANSNGLCKTQDIGSSYQKRTLRILKCSTNPNAGKKIFFLDAAIHAREHLAPATLLYIIKKLVDGYKNNVLSARNIFKKYDIHFHPIVNPDGYDYTFTGRKNRFWRKTRQPYGMKFGADPNRNFDTHFGGPSTSDDPSSDIYCGPFPFSEPETLAMARYLTSIKNRLRVYISFHAYGQFWLTPPGYTRQLPADYKEMMRVANAGVKAIQRVTGGRWLVGQPANVGLYEAAGGTFDWIKDTLKVQYAFALEMSPGFEDAGGAGGFMAYPEDIVVSGESVYDGVLAAANAVP